MRERDKSGLAFRSPHPSPLPEGEGIYCNALPVVKFRAEQYRSSAFVGAYGIRPYDSPHYPCKIIPVFGTPLPDVTRAISASFT